MHHYTPQSLHMAWNIFYCAEVVIWKVLPLRISGQMRVTVL